MIYVERPKPPPFLKSREFERARSRAATFFRKPHDRRAQERHDFVSLITTRLRDPILRAFKGKCAYCESRIEDIPSPPHIDRFRPTAGALSLSGGVATDHYWWLAYEWGNLLLACAPCVVQKGRRFPVAGRRVNKPVKDPALLRKERPQLLDPTVDDPAKHLVFAIDGLVAGLTESGQITCEILGLNRQDLVTRRRAVAAQMHADFTRARALERRGALPGNQELRELARGLAWSRSLSFAAMRWQLLCEWREHPSISPWLRNVMTTEYGQGEPPTLDAKVRKAAFRERARKQSSQLRYSLSGKASDSAESKSRYLVKTRLIERVVIRNFKGIESLKLEITQATTRQAPWLMLLGENGSGKSSVLQAIALALLGPEDRKRLRPAPVPSRLLREGATEGRVEVHLTDTPPLVFGIKRKTVTGPKRPQVFVLGYGATRMLPKEKTKHRPVEEEAKARVRASRVDNLFNPTEALSDARSWLLGLDKPAFDNIALALKRLLDLPESGRLTREKGSVRIRAHGSVAIDLDKLSDGYQSVIALAAELMMILQIQWSVMEHAEGIVLIDELDIHLHPRWKMRIVHALRTAFPRVQFIVTTHDPLCLRGLHDGEVIVLQRSAKGRIAAVSDLPSVAGLRVDQLLTSEHFGLHSTIDPELELEFREYYGLLAKPRPTSTEKARRDELRDKLTPLQEIGRTRRERLLLQGIDLALAEEQRTGHPASREQVNRKTADLVASLWKQSASKESKP